MRNKYNFKFILLLIVFISGSISSFAQKGPGGVSQDVASPRNSDCKVWCDATSIQAADGAYITVWEDESHSEIDNDMHPPGEVSLQPIVRKDVSAGINGHPIIQFGDGRRLLFDDSQEINMGGPFTEKTTFMVFRTAENITDRQLIYEEGGGWRGLNVYIDNGELYVGGYDNHVDGDGTPEWATTNPHNNNNNHYTYTKTTVQPYTTYVITHIFNGPIGVTTGFLRGFINGQQFISGDASDVGSLAEHPDNPGLGAVNGDSYFVDGSHNGDGDFPFLGDYSEFILYETNLNDAERIIVENYLGAKYSANNIVNDHFRFKTAYGNDVIGIGREQTGHNHNVSQGRNMFEMRAEASAFNQNKEYLMVGHDNNSTDTWTSVNAPDNVLRIEREWRFDHSSADLGDITFKLDISEMPAFPDDEYDRYVILLDKSAGAFSDFNSGETEVIELEHITGDYYEATSDIPDGAFMTFGVVKPTVRFKQNSGYGFESAAGNKSIHLQLNYTPVNEVAVELELNEISADNFNDFAVSSITSITFDAEEAASVYTFNLLDDLTVEDSETFQLQISSTGATTTFLQIGSPNQYLYTIYDNDNIPKTGFQMLSHNADEDAGFIQVEVVLSGYSGTQVSVDYQLNTSGETPTEGTATQGSDYNFSPGTLTFNSDGIQIFTFEIVDDLTDEDIESVVFELHNIQNADLEEGQQIYSFSIVNNDNKPLIGFSSLTSSNPEIIGDPEIQVELSRVSEKDITVNYDVTNATASSGLDYHLGVPGKVTIPAGQTTGEIPFIVTNDVDNNETDEIIVIGLTNSTNATIDATASAHTYTIEEYASFEWHGSAGVGHADDNIFWYIADEISGSHDENINNLEDISPNNNDANKDSNGSRAKLQVTSNTMNDNKVLRFDGSNDFYKIPDDDRINDKDGYQSKYIFLAFRTPADVNQRQVIYEEGGETNGLSLYIENGELKFHAWALGESPAWGGTGSSSKEVASTIDAEQEYFVSCMYEAGSKLELFINGTSADVLNDNSIGTMPSHNRAIIGGVNSSILFPDGDTDDQNAYFAGDLAEIIYYNDAPINEIRRRIIENYLAARYNIDFTNSADKFYHYEDTHGQGVVGIGMKNSYHLDGQGNGKVRIKSPLDIQPNEYFFIGHDNGIFDQNETDVPNGIEYRIDRVWRADKTGNPGKITVAFNLSDFNFHEGNDLELLIDADGNFSSGAVRHTANQSYDAGNKIITFKNVDFSDADYFTIGFTPSQWTGIVSGDWNNPNNWYGNVPDPTQNAKIPASPVGNHFPNTFSANIAEINNLTIESGASFTIPSGKGLTVNGDLEVNGTMTLQSDVNGTGSLITNGNIAVTGTVEVERFFPGDDYHYISSPVESADSYIFYRGINNNLYEYDETASDNWEDADPTNDHTGWVTHITGSLEVAKGYAHWYPNDIKYIITGGKFNNGEYTTDLTYTDNFNNTYDGWNLVGNPYPSGVDARTSSADNFIDENSTKITGTLYFWDEPANTNSNYASGDYASWNSSGGVSGSGGNTPNGVVAVGQSFFVQTLNPVPGDGKVYFNNAMRVHENDESGTHFFKSKPVNQIQRFRLNVTNTKGNFNEILIAFTPKATDNYDRLYDGIKRKGNAQLALYTMLNNNDFAIQAFAPFSGEKTIPVGMDIGTAGTHTFRISTIENINDAVDIYLKDNQENITIDLRKTPMYEFYSQAGKFKERFSLEFRSPYIWTGAVSTNWNNANNWQNKKIPQQNNSVFISADIAQQYPVIQNSAHCKNLVIAPGAQLTIATNGSLTVWEKMYLKAENNRFATIINNHNLEIKGNVEQECPVSGVENLIGTALSNPDFSSLKSVGLQTFVEVLNRWKPVSEWNNTIGTGYKISCALDSKGLIFRGLLNTESVDVHITSNTLQNGWNLLSNPFPAYFDAKAFVQNYADNKINGSIWFVDKRKQNGNYACVNQIGAVNTDIQFNELQLTPCQAFFVKAQQSIDIKFDKKYASHFKPMRPENDLQHIKRIKISLKNSKHEACEMLLAATKDATQQYDNRFDAPMLFNQNQIACYSMLNGRPFAIQALSDFHNKSVPIGIRVHQKGEYVLELNYFQKPPDNHVLVFIEDITTNQVTNLHESSTYRFTCNEVGNIDDRFVIHFVNKCIWTGNQSDKWQHAGNWTPGIPTSQDQVVIPANESVQLNGNAECFTLNIEPNAELVITNTGNLSIKNNLHLYANNQVNGIVVNNGNINVDGQTLIEQPIPANKQLISSPVKHSHVMVAGDGLKQYGEFSKWIPVSHRDALETSGGYLMKATNDTILTFKGILHQGTIHRSVEIAHNSIQASVGKGWNAIGNPYPAFLDAEQFIKQNAETEQIISGNLYFFNLLNNTKNTTTQFGCYNKLGSINLPTTFNRLIPPSQAFFVQANTNGEVLFHPEMQSTKNIAINKPGINAATILLALHDFTGEKDETLIGCSSEATNGMDFRLDALKLKNDNHLAFYSLLANDEFAIQAIPEIEQQTVIPLGIDVMNNGEHTISLTELKNVDKNLKIMLEDKNNNQMVDLKNSNYTFLGQANTLHNRFALHFTKIGTEKNKIRKHNDVTIYSYGKKLYVNTSERQLHLQICIYNVVGQKVWQKYTKTFDNQNIIFDINTLQKGIYFVKLQDINTRTMQTVKIYIW